MNLYLLTPLRDADYDETKAVIIRARSSVRARNIAQSTFERQTLRHGRSPQWSWLSRFDVGLIKIGETTPGTKQTEGVVLESNRGS